MTCIPPSNPLLSQFLPHLLSFWLWIKRDCKWYAVGWPPDCHIWLRNVSVHVSHVCLFLASLFAVTVTHAPGTQWLHGSQTVCHEQQTCVNQTHSSVFPGSFLIFCLFKTLRVFFFFLLAVRHTNKGEITENERALRKTGKAENEDRNTWWEPYLWHCLVDFGSVVLNLSQPLCYAFECTVSLLASYTLLLFAGLPQVHLESCLLW